jgi:Subtilase family
MTWKLEIRNQDIKLHPVADVIAVHSTQEPAKRSELATISQSTRQSESERPDDLVRFIEGLFGKPHDKRKQDKDKDKDRDKKRKLMERTAIDQRLFERGGWNFVPSNRDLKKAAASRRPLANGDIAREVFRTDKGSLLITTDLVTLQLAREMSEMEARSIMRRDRLEDVRRLSFGRNLFEVKLPSGKSLPDEIERLQKTKNYRWVEPTLVQTIKPKGAAALEAAALAPADVEFSKQWQHDNTGFDDDGFPVGTAGQDLDSLKAWNLSEGAGVRIAVIDAGMQIDHPDLAPGIKGGGYFLTSPTGKWEFFSLAEHAATFPVTNHGTFCLGLAGARSSGTGQKEQSGLGIAPKSSLIPIACPSNSLTTQTTLAAAIHFAVEPSEYDRTATAKQRADVISCSLDTDNPLMSVLAEAIYFANTQGRRRRGRALGVPIFWAVNNLQTPLSEDPVCCLPEVMAIGKYSRSGGWGGGAFGSNLAFLAPGVNVFSTTIGSDNMYGTGTSYATPLAAGVAALVIRRFPGMTAAEVCEKMIASCEPMDGTSGYDARYGYGKLNAFKAVSD